MAMNSAHYSMASSEQANVAAIVVSAEDKKAAQEGIAVAKAWLKAAGKPCKLVFFHEIHGSEWSNLGVSYRARIAYRVAS